MVSWLAGWRQLNSSEKKAGRLGEMCWRPSCACMQLPAPGGILPPPHPQGTMSAASDPSAILPPPHPPT